VLRLCPNEKRVTITLRLCHKLWREIVPRYGYGIKHRLFMLCRCCTRIRNALLVSCLAALCLC
jgi:hypothetical protein